MKRIIDLFIESPVIDHNQDGLGDPNKIEHNGITRLEKVKRWYAACKEDWNSLGVDTIYAGNKVEWFRDTTLGQARGFLLSPKNEIMGFMSGAIPSLTAHPNFLGIHLVFVFKPHQGKGNGLSLYQNAIEKFGGIISDSTLTDGSLGIWKSLSKKYPTYQWVQNPRPRVRSGLVPIRSEDMTNKMTSTNEPFVMSKEELQGS